MYITNTISISIHNSNNFDLININNLKKTITSYERYWIACFRKESDLISFWCVDNKEIYAALKGGLTVKESVLSNIFLPET